MSTDLEDLPRPSGSRSAGSTPPAPADRSRPLERRDAAAEPALGERELTVLAARLSILLRQG